jgi:hypothetical protein
MPPPASLRRRRSLPAVAGLLAALTLAVPATAQAGATQESIFQDDQLLLFSGPGTRDATLADLRSLGVDTVRAFVKWADVAPSPDSTTRPSFDATDPGAYPAENWAKYDGLVTAARASGLSILLTPTSGVPAWASQCSGSVARRRTCNPSAAEFGLFVRALGLRYSGNYAGLPKVSRWAMFNEPNVGSWLTPQYIRRRGQLIANSPIRYRSLVHAGTAALRATGHPHDQIMLGETAPIGHTGGALATRPIATAAFLRDLFCIDSAGRALRGTAAALRNCTRPGRFDVSAISHHPYVRGGSQPPLTATRPDEITIANSSRLKLILARAARRGRIRGGLPIYYTEYGYQTDPPDRIFGVGLSAQARYMNESDYIAWRDGQVKGMAQYLLNDDFSLDGFQTGLRFSSGRSKPALAAYRLPVWVVGHRSFVTVFGQARAAPNGQQARVAIQARSGRGGFKTVKTVTTRNSKGFFRVSVPRRGSTWRLRWASPSGAVYFSREAAAARR